MDTATARRSNAPVLASGRMPAMLAATGASSRPMRATIGPMVAGGSTVLIQPGPKRRMIRATRVNTRPETMNPPSASG